MKTTRLLAFLLLFLTSGMAQADVSIARSARVKNKGCCCFYACAETIGRVWKDDRLDGIVDWQYELHAQDGASSADIKAVLGDRNVKYKTLEDATIAWVRHQVEVGRPVIIS